MPDYAQIVQEYKDKLEQERESIRKKMKKDADIKIEKISKQFELEKQAYQSNHDVNIIKQQEKIKKDLEATKKEKSNLRKQNLRIKKELEQSKLQRDQEIKNIKDELSKQRFNSDPLISFW